MGKDGKMPKSSTATKNRTPTAGDMRRHFALLATLTQLLANEYEQCADCGSFEQPERTCREIADAMEATSALLDHYGVDHSWLLPEIQRMRAAWPKQ